MLKKILIIIGLLLLTVIIGSLSIGFQQSKIVWDEDRIALALEEVGFQTSEIKVSAENHGFYSTNTAVLKPINNIIFNEIKINSIVEHGPILIDEKGVSLGLALSHMEIEIIYSDGEQLKTFAGLRASIETDFFGKNTGNIWLDHTEASYDQLLTIFQIKSTDKIKLEVQFDFDTLGFSSNGVFRVGNIVPERLKQTLISYSIDEVQYQWNSNRYESKLESNDEFIIKGLEISSFDQITTEVNRAELRTSTQANNEMANVNINLLIEGIKKPFFKDQKESPAYTINVDLKADNIESKYFLDSDYLQQLSSTGGRSDTFKTEDMLANLFSNLDLDTLVEIKADQKEESLFYSKLDMDFNLNDELTTNHSNSYNLEALKEKIHAEWKLKIERAFLSKTAFLSKMSQKLETLVTHEYLQSEGDYFELKARLIDGTATLYDREVDIDELIRLMNGQLSDGEGNRSDPNTQKSTERRSLHSKHTTQVEFVNNSNAIKKIYWLDFNGKRKLYRVLGPGQRYTQDTFFTHPWLIADDHDREIKIVYPKKRKTKIKLDERPIKKVSTNNDIFKRIENKTFSTNVNDFFAEYDGTGKYSGRTRSGDKSPYVNSNTIGWIEGVAGGFTRDQINFFKNNLSIGNGDPVRLDKAELQFLEKFKLIRFVNSGANIKVVVTELGMTVIRDFPRIGENMSLEDYVLSYQSIEGQSPTKPSVARGVVECITSEGQTLFASSAESVGHFRLG